jgi:hypothetical protein
VVLQRKNVLIVIYPGGICNISACNSTRKAQSKKRRMPSYSSCSKGATTWLESVLAVDGDVPLRLGRNFGNQKSDIFVLVAPDPDIAEPSKCYRCIQHIQNV